MIGTLARSTARTTVVLVLRLVTLAASLVLLARLLPPELYGPYAALASLAVLLGLLPTLGCGYIMLSQASRDSKAIEYIWRAAWPLSLCVGAILLGLLMVAISWMGMDRYLGHFIPAGIGIIELFMMPLIQLCSWIHQANNQVARGQLLQWLPLGLRLAATLPCLAISHDQRLNTFVLLQILAATIALIMSLGVTLKRFELQSTPRLISAPELRQGLSYCAMHVMAMNPSEIDKIAITQYASAHEAGIYAITNRVLGALMTPISALLLVAQPDLFQMGEQRSARRRQLIRLIFLYGSAGGILATLTMVLGGQILPWLFGSNYLDVSHLAPFIAAAALPLALRISSGTVLVALGHPFHRLIFEIVGVITLLALISRLVPAYGLTGAAIALGCAELLMAVVGWFLVAYVLRRQPGATNPCQEQSPPPSKAL